MHRKVIQLIFLFGISVSIIACSTPLEKAGYSSEKNPYEGIDILKKVLKSEKLSSRELQGIYSELGFNYEEIGNITEAENSFKEAIRVSRKREDFKSYIFYGEYLSKLLFQNKKYKKAYQQFETLINDTEPFRKYAEHRHWSKGGYWHRYYKGRYYWAHIYLATIQYYEGKYDVAIDLVSKVIEMSKVDPDTSNLNGGIYLKDYIHFFRSYLYAKTGNRDGAISDYSKFNLDSLKSLRNSHHLFIKNNLTDESMVLYLDQVQHYLAGGVKSLDSSAHSKNKEVVPTVKQTTPDLQLSPDIIEMKSSIYKRHKKGIVLFPHKRHSREYKIECNQCHHIYGDFRENVKPTEKEYLVFKEAIEKGGATVKFNTYKNFWTKDDKVQKCEVCHYSPKTSSKKIRELKKTGRLLKRPESHYRAIHRKCTKCHKLYAKNKKVSGPIKCIDCHPKRAK